MDIPIETFVTESRELLALMEAGLLKLEAGLDSASSEYQEVVNEIFRAAHTIKGSAGLFGLDAVVAFTHTVENLMDCVREGSVGISAELIGLLLQCSDHMAALVDAYIQTGSAPETLVKNGEQLLMSLTPWLPRAAEAASPQAVEEVSESGCWHISLRLGRDTLRNGMDPLAILRYLAGLGELRYCEVIDDDLPLEDFDPENFYLGFVVGLAGPLKKSDIEDAFVFVRDEAEISIVPPQETREQLLRLIQSQQGKSRLGEMLVCSGAITQRELEAALHQQKDPETLKKPLGEILVANKSTSEQLVDAALARQRQKNSARMIRVDAERLDSLINLIGELVINRQRVDLLTSGYVDQDLQEAVASLAGLTEQVRDAALNLRMVAIGETFHRFKRIVRDTAQELGKDIELVLQGEDTELDRSMVEKLTDPLTHIVRNAIDHGIESRERRAESGKPLRGTIKLSAYHDAGNVVIEIQDDGGGINTERVRERAIEKGLLEAGVEYSEHQIHQLIFHPGFSTAEKITNMSGRGVGMDVVKRNVEDLQGVVDIKSHRGQGTLITVRLPLTLAIIDGFHVNSAGTHFIVPQATVVECLDFNSVRRLEGGSSIQLRGELVPYVHLQELLELSGQVNQQKKLVVVQFGDERAAVVVDELYGELQTVVKPLSPVFGTLKGIGGCSLLGNGEIAFILDVPQLIALATADEVHRTANSALMARRHAPSDHLH